MAKSLLPIVICMEIGKEAKGSVPFGPKSRIKISRLERFDCMPIHVLGGRYKMEVRQMELPLPSINRTLPDTESC
jgi:hypothetical protein